MVVTSVNFYQIASTQMGLVCDMLAGSTQRHFLLAPRLSPPARHGKPNSEDC